MQKMHEQENKNSTTKNSIRHWLVPQALALCLMTLCLASCATHKETEVHVVSTALPPVELVRKVPEPTLDGKTIKDLVEHTVELRGALDKCNGRLLELQKWRYKESQRKE